MTKDILKNKIVEIPIEETERIDNEIRSNLRYSWQKTIAFAISYKPTIQEVIDELEESFLAFIPKNHRKYDVYRKIVNDSFRKILGKLFSSNDIACLQLENEFIEIAMEDIRVNIL
ncbi:MAG: hypothetical protein ACTSQB_01935 [Candidatus Heimdallarchaeota archaeon]